MSVNRHTGGSDARLFVEFWGILEITLAKCQGLWLIRVPFRKMGDGQLWSPNLLRIQFLSFLCLTNSVSKVKPSLLMPPASVMNKCQHRWFSISELPW